MPTSFLKTCLNKNLYSIFRQKVSGRTTIVRPDLKAVGFNHKSDTILCVCYTQFYPICRA